MDNRIKYKQPEIETITLDNEISVYMASTDNLPPIGTGDETTSTYLNSSTSDPFKSTLV